MARMARTTILYALLALLMIDALIEVGFIGSMVGYLHKDGIFHIVGPNAHTVQLFLKPKHLSVNQGHTSNGAAGTALILVGLLGFIVLSQRHFIKRRFPRYLLPIFTLWTVLTVLSFLLTLAALIYTFVVINQTSGQSIAFTDPSLNLAAPIRYPIDKWAPQTWFAAVLQLDFVNESERNKVRHHLRTINGWEWNLIPIFILQFVITPLVLLEFADARRDGTRLGPSDQEIEEPKVVG